MTTTTDNKTKKVTKTSNGIACKTIASHIKSQVYHIDEYDVITSSTEFAGRIIVTPKDRETIHCIGDLVTIAEAYKVEYYVTYNPIDNRIEFVIY